MMHAKTMTVDGAWSIISSANLDNRSLDMSDEVNFGVADSTFSAELTRTFEEDLRRCRQLTLDEWRRRPVLDRANEQFWGVLSELW